MFGEMMFKRQRRRQKGIMHSMSKTNDRIFTKIEQLGLSVPLGCWNEEIRTAMGILESKTFASRLCLSDQHRDLVLLSECRDHPNEPAPVVLVGLRTHVPVSLGTRSPDSISIDSIVFSPQVPSLSVFPAVLESWRLVEKFVARDANFSVVVAFVIHFDAVSAPKLVVFDTTTERDVSISVALQDWSEFWKRSVKQIL